MKKIAVVIASLLIAACASSPKNNTAPAQQSNAQSASPASAATTSSATELDKLAAEIEKLQQQSDYFDYNKYVIKPEYRSVLQKEAEFIKAHKNDLITLEGNADERGSDSYNLALGTKRSEAVQKSLIQLGVPANQIKLVSFGKGKPRLSCHEEKCWKENRRVDFVHKLG